MSGTRAAAGMSAASEPSSIPSRPRDGARGWSGKAAGTLPLPLIGGGHGRGWYRLPLARAMENRCRG